MIGCVYLKRNFIYNIIIYKVIFSSFTSFCKHFKIKQLKTEILKCYTTLEQNVSAGLVRVFRLKMISDFRISVKNILHFSSHPY